MRGYKFLLIASLLITVASCTISTGSGEAGPPGKVATIDQTVDVYSPVIAIAEHPYILPVAPDVPDVGLPSYTFANHTYLVTPAVPAYTVERYRYERSDYFEYALKPEINLEINEPPQPPSYHRYATVHWSDQDAARRIRPPSVLLC